MKNTLLCDNRQYVHYLSLTETGKVHDKKIADEQPILLPLGSVLRQDTGFEGHRPKDIIIEQPIKKTRGMTLNFSQEIYNQMISKLRIVIEHANSGVKRLRIIKDTIRLKDFFIRDLTMAVACALHNFRVNSPSRNYKPCAVA